MAATPSSKYMTEGEVGLGLALLVGAFLCARAAVAPLAAGGSPDTCAT